MTTTTGTHIDLGTDLPTVRITREFDAPRA